MIGKTLGFDSIAAGGYDAIWVLCLSPPPTSTSPSPTPLEQVETLLRGWNEMSVRPLSREAWVEGSDEVVEGAGEGGLRVDRGPQGIDRVPGLKEAVERAKKM